MAQIKTSSSAAAVRVIPTLHLGLDAAPTCDQAGKPGHRCTVEPTQLRLNGRQIYAQHHAVLHEHTSGANHFGDVTHVAARKQQSKRVHGEDGIAVQAVKINRDQICRCSFGENARPRRAGYPSTCSDRLVIDINPLGRV